MGREGRNTGASGRSLHNVPNRLRCDVFSPNLAGSDDGAEDEAGGYPRSFCAVVHRAFHPVWLRNRSNMFALANQVGDHPNLLPDLQVGGV
jgi:hypothetical protein